MLILQIPKKIRQLSRFLLLFLVAGSLSAQLRYFDKIPTLEGDVNLSVRQVLQDKQGIIWLATFSGLYLFEGDEYILQHQFSSINKINPDVTALLEDNDNNIWIGTNDGLYKYNPENEELTTFRTDANASNSLTTNKIRSLAIDKFGRIWIGTYDKGLFVYDADLNGFIPIVFDNYTQHVPVYIKTIFTNSKGEIWFGTLNNGLYRFSYKNSQIESVLNFREEDKRLKLSNNYVFEIFEDIDGTMAVGTRNGLNIYNATQETFEDISTDAFWTGSMNNYFRSIIRDRNNKLWIGTWGGLIVCNSFSDIQTGNYQLVIHNKNSANSISHNQIMDVFQDVSGIIWMATENGLNRYDPYYNQFQPLTGEAISKFSEQTATDFFEWKNGIIMLTLSDGLLLEQDNVLKPFCSKTFQEFKNEKFYALCVDSKQNVWAGSSNGLLIWLDSTSKKILTFKHSSENIPIHSIVELENGALAVGTYGEGLKYFNSKTGKFQSDRGLSATIQINDIYIDTKKQLWVATQLGIFKKGLKTEAFEYYLPDNPDSILNPNIYFDIAESASGIIYVGGRNGLYRYNDSINAFVRINFDSQVKLWVTDLQFDSNQNLWLNLNFNKIAKWDVDADELFTFSVNNGIRSSSYNKRGFFIDNNDRILISGFDQIFEFNITDLVSNKFSPKPIFTALRINNTEIHPGVKLNNQQILDKNISYEKELVLNHLNKDFTISFTSVSYLNSKENQFKYILHGYDEHWHMSNAHEARYADLTPGRYTFEVFGSNNDGKWSEASAKINIRILPAPLLSTFAFIIYFLCLIIGVYFVRRFIIARIRLRHELLIEKVKRDKEEKFNQERLRFFTNISHELRTPLTLIMGPIKDLLESEKPKNEVVRLHQLILNNSQRLLSLVNQLLDFRKSLHQNMKLKVINTNLVEVVESNIEAFAYMANEKNIRVEFKTSEPRLNGWFDLEKLDIILFNILSNAFKYTPAFGIVDIEVNIASPNKNLNTQHIELSITNTGKGIPKQLQEKVFERFYQVVDKSDITKFNTGTGIGLSLVKDLVELHHGKISLKSEPGKFTTFTIYLPYSKEDYSGDEIFDFKRDADRRTRELIKTIEPKDDESIFEKTNLHTETILIVEDNTELREYLAGFLSKSYKVYSAIDGIDGLERCLDNNPDLIVSDVMMENMDGFNFCRKIKSTPEVSHIPVILMTALANVENKLEGYKTGADDYITKPFEPELLKLRIRNVLDNRRKIKEEFIQNDAITANELTISKIDEEFLNKVIDLVNDNLDNASFDIDSFSKQLGMSTSQLYRKIKAITGISPNEFIRTYRLRKAEKMISETNLTISEIAYKVGFNDSLYFSKCFKKQFGISPSKFRK